IASGRPAGSVRRRSPAAPCVGRARVSWKPPGRSKVSVGFSVAAAVVAVDDIPTVSVTAAAREARTRRRIVVVGWLMPRILERVLGDRGRLGPGRFGRPWPGLIGDW